MLDTFKHYGRVIWVVLLLAVAGGTGYHLGAGRVQQKWDRERAGQAISAQAAEQAARVKEGKLAAAVAAIDIQHKELANAQAQNDICAASLLLALSGCASRPVAQVQVSPRLPAPPAWMMERLQPNLTQRLQSLWSVSPATATAPSGS
ncbi:hypothetical protein OL229_04320 [Neisseriaceae bacterium JH1-16]|nr:hypothetical protein [Neisseriaceae bacterium JH1-16]